MTLRSNQYGQPIGAALPDWQPVALPSAQVMSGRVCRLERLDAERHTAELYHAFAAAPDDRDWTYLTEERPGSPEAFRQWLCRRAQESGFITYTIICTRREKAVGLVSFLRIDPQNGSLEIGGVTWSPLMQRTTIGTEALWLMMAHGFQLGYRRCEWKCDSLNAPSRNAALRLGFSYEGTFRQMMARKGRSRDSDWFSIIDGEWPAIDRALQAWLAMDNFDADGRQRQRLQELLRAEQAIDGGVDRPAV